MSFDATVELAPAPSVLGVQLLFFAHAMPLAAIVFTLEPGVPMAALALGLAASWLWVRRHPVLGYGPRALVRLTWHADGSWTLHEAAGARHEAQLLGDSYRHPALLVLNFALTQGGRRTRVLLGDELERAQLQRLRARLATAAAAVRKNSRP